MKTDIEVKFEWGAEGIIHLRPWADVIIIVDVMSFSTCVDIVLSKNSIVYPYRFKDQSALNLAHEKKAALAVARGQPGFTLSPVSLVQFPKNSALVLPSPNGATLSLISSKSVVMNGCLRNAASVATMAAKLGRKIAIIAAGERWANDTLRVAYEDLVGSGAIIHGINGVKSVEAAFASLAFKNSVNNNFKDLINCATSIELSRHGYAGDVEIALQYNVSNVAPILQEQYFKNSK